MSTAYVEIYPKRVRQNAELLRHLCEKQGVGLVAVIKGFDAHPAILRALAEAGYTCMASSRLPHLAAAREGGFARETMMLRLPAPQEAEDVVRYADSSLNSEWETLLTLNSAAAKQGKIHHVILMRDLGDLREGVYDKGDFYHLAEKTEGLKHLHLLGIGVNLTCYGSVIPSTENLSRLAADAAEINRRLGRDLEVVSGGSTSSLPLVIKGGLPKGINQLRLGEALVVPWDLIHYWECPLPGLRNDCLVLKSPVIETAVKPSLPQGELGRNGFGTEMDYEDRGMHKRALLAMGVLDFGDWQKLLPVDEQAHVLGASSDHLILDVEDSKKTYYLGEEVAFTLRYRAMLNAMSCPLVGKVVLGEDGIKKGEKQADI